MQPSSGGSMTAQVQGDDILKDGGEVHLGLESPCPLVPVSLVIVSEAQPVLSQGTWPITRAITWLPTRYL